MGTHLRVGWKIPPSREMEDTSSEAMARNMFISYKLQLLQIQLPLLRLPLLPPPCVADSSLSTAHTLVASGMLVGF